MSKYIDADKVIDYANQEVTAAFYYPQNAHEQRKRDEQEHRDKWAFVKQVMVVTPPADVQEVRYGRWEPVQYGCICSVCGKRKEQFNDNFCANCGAKMKGDK